MNNAYVWGAVVILLLLGAYWYLQESGGRIAPEQEDLGTYAYACENGSEFTMMPADDLSSIKLSGGSQGMFTGDVTLSAVAGARFEGMLRGSPIKFVGAGEEVQLTVGSETAICNPKPSADMAPWNWGDTGEGGGMEQDVRLIVAESIVGKWQSTEDPKFIREFKSDGTVVDWHDGKAVSRGTFQVFTKGFPIEVAFPLQANATYIQLAMTGSEADKLNFKVGKLTPEELELTYMDRGGVLRFKSAP